MNINKYNTIITRKNTQKTTTNNSKPLGPPDIEAFDVVLHFTFKEPLNAGGDVSTSTNIDPQNDRVM